MVHDKLKLVEAYEFLKNELLKFKEIYFKYFKAKTPELENIDNFALNFQNLKLKEAIETAEKSQEVFELYNSNKEFLNKNFFKKIYEEYASANKSKITFEDVKHILSLSVNKSHEIKAFLLSKQNLNFKMKELLKVFEHLVDENIIEYITEIKQHFEIENKNDERLILKVLDYYSQTLVLIKNVEELLHFIQHYNLSASKFSESLDKIQGDLKECEEIPISELCGMFFPEGT